MNGFLNLNKPAGFTSHDCVAKVRKLLRIKRVGHAGTLDPAAVGVLPIAIGRATRLLQYLRSDKAYRATIRFGVTTTTDDLEGETLTCQAVPSLTLEAIQEKLPLFLGTIRQIPPSYSAIQVDGKRLYDLARSGEVVEVPARTIEVYHIEILEWRSGEFPELEVAIRCGSGTYIRAIARDLGEVLNTGATLAHLIRTQSSGFELSDSLTFETLEQQLSSEALDIMTPDVALSHLAVLKLSNGTIARRWRQGQKLSIEEISTVLTTEQPLRIWDESDRFLGIAQVNEGRLLPLMVFEPIG